MKGPSRGGGAKKAGPVRRLVAAIAACGIVAAVAVPLGIGWYFSNEAIAVEHGRTYKFRIIDVSDTTVTLPANAQTRRPGTWGLLHEDGRAVLSKIVESSPTSVEWRIEKNLKGEPRTGRRAVLDHWVWDRDPKRDLGLDYREVHYRSAVGDMPAWFVPASRRTWVIAVHGRNADRAETFRMMKAAHAADLPILSIAYRNDRGAPPSPEGTNLLGWQEWRDVASAIEYARGQGATGVVLHGYSMGGGMVVNALRHSKDPSFVKAVVLDSPVLDWNATLDKQGAQRGLPQFLTTVAKSVLERRTGIDLDALDHRVYAPDLRTPTLLFTTTRDAMVDNRPSYEFARRAPDTMVRHISVEADHTDAWNVDPDRYERTLRSFLADVD